MKRKIRAKTCFLMGVAAGLLYSVAAVLQLLGIGQASFLHQSAYAFTGAMLLFLAVTERGPQNRRRRMQLLGLFLLVLVSYPNLPPVSTLAGALVLPLLTAMYGGRENRPFLLSLAASEAVYVGLHTYAIMNADFAPIVSIVLLILGLERAFVAFRLYSAAAQRQDSQSPLKEKH